MHLTERRCKVSPALLIAVVLFAGTAGGAAPQMVTQAAGTAHEGLHAVASAGDTATVVGMAGRILESNDAGATWRVVAAPDARGALLGVTLQASAGIAVGQYGQILLRQGAGTWTVVASGTEERLFAAAMNTAGEAVVVGSFGTILWSTDGGRHWMPVAPDWANYFSDGLDPHLYDVAVSEDGVATVVGELGLVLRSTDRGAHWSRVEMPRGADDGTPISWFGLDLRPDGTGYLVGQHGQLLRSEDHGRRWTRLDTGSHANLFDVASLPGGRVVVAGMYEVLVSEDAGGTWQAIEDADAAQSWYQGVAAVGKSGLIVLVGQGGRISGLR